MVQRLSTISSHRRVEPITKENYINEQYRKSETTGKETQGTSQYRRGTRSRESAGKDYQNKEDRKTKIER